jgi:hypothetical protein
MALGCGLTSVRGNRGKNYENEPLVPQKHTKKKKYVADNNEPGQRRGGYMWIIVKVIGTITLVVHDHRQDGKVKIII